jgi:exodeoxyribonuclease V alpha subunit
VNIEEEKFSALDRQFGDFLRRLASKSQSEVRLAAMAASRARGDGHICTSLGAITASENPAAFRKRLRDSGVVGKPGEFFPLILDQKDRLYLRRYWEYEQQLAAAIRLRAAAQVSAAAADLQQLAAEKAVRGQFTVITGGPGTGKTWTVMKILQLLLASPGGTDLRMALAAPTGKAAARLTDAARGADLDLKASTIHRLLGYLPSSPYFRHDAANPLPIDVLIVDEASMIDLALMAKLASAVPTTARLILLGDRDQLASVEAGNVLADICAAAEAAFPNEPLHGCVIALTRNYRFKETGGIFRVSSAINAGDAEAALAALREGADEEATWRPLPARANLVEALHDRVVTGFQDYLKASEPAEALTLLQKFRILCALRRGPFGVETLNAIAQEILTDAGLLQPRPGWYRGQPIMITRNDYNLSLFNGDSGIILPDPDADGELRAFFPSAETKVRRFLPARLPTHETAFALTVHKSQGSEFDRLLLVLPEQESPLLTRELLYTALTRARTRAEVWAPETILRLAIAHPTERHSGLRDALEG